MRSYPKSEAIYQRNLQYIPGGVVSVNRNVEPRLVFRRGAGANIWDADGNRYLDYHGAFAAHMLGHHEPAVLAAVRCVLDSESSLFGSGSTELEGRLAELICTNVDFIETAQFLNTGSEATYQAIRLARAATGRSHIIKPQGGYHGWHNDVACNLMSPLDRAGPRVSPGEYPFLPISAGIPEEHQGLVHVVNFNDLESVEWVCKRYPVAAMILEPILQNIGVVHPKPGYLRGLRELADQYGFVLIFDEVKTGFRHALGGYASIAGIRPDIGVYGKAVASGYPIAVIGGRRELMEYFVHPDSQKRVLLAGTYNAHPVPVAAAIATIECLLAGGGEVYRRLEHLGSMLAQGINEIVERTDLPATLVRQGSAFCLYFMDHAPSDWHEIAANNDGAADLAMRQGLIERGIYVFPLAIKQCSLSSAHTESDVEFTLEQVDAVLSGL